jgi:hypothetical protein
MNNNIVLICGKTATGKSSSFMNLNEPEKVLYLNCENNKATPFKNKFRNKTITDPLQVYSYFEQAAAAPEKITTIVIDSLTFLMDLYESVYVSGAANGQKAWGEYAQFLKVLMSNYVANAPQRVIFTGHTSDVLSEDAVMETLVKVKGSINNNGVEAFFSNVIATKKVKISELENYKNALLTITPHEEMLGFKYVFQTQMTKKTVNERMRGPMGMWDVSETYINNDTQLVLDRLAQYYS